MPYDPHSDPDEAPYDPRRNPERGVRVHPLPRSYHRRFAAFVAELDVMAQSHLATWRLAVREGLDDRVVNANLVYWTSFRKALNTIEYLGTTNDPSKRRRATHDTDR